MSNRIYKYWIFLGKSILVAAIGTTIASWFVKNSVLDNLSDLFYITVLSIHLISERFRKSSLPIFEKAFCYFVSYLIFFFLLGRQLRILGGVNVAGRGAFIFLGVNVPLVIYQVIYFRRKAQSKEAAQLVLILGSIEIAIIAFCVLMYLHGIVNK